ncbi:hypothetical protein ABW19_dt0204111 [Dactylella cylindrospora]|nr:hypothetical protein ABW19_dt0204111 [Dactylella cylindrospora]
MSQPTKTIAFFGATGGCALTTLELSLRAGYHCSALVRSSKKLSDMLSKTTPTANLRIVEGDALNKEPIRDVLVDTTTGAIVDTIVYGLGMRPTMTSSVTFKFEQPTLCEDTMKNIISVVEELKPAVAPMATIISTTGVSSENDVPVLFLPLYHWALKTPHIDKGKLEEAVVDAAKKGIYRDFIIVRPSLLTDGKATHGDVKVGYSGSEKKSGKGELTLAEGGSGWKSVKGVAVGYTISRKDVGAWIFEEAVVNGGGNGFLGQRVTLTY